MGDPKKGSAGPHSAGIIKKFEQNTKHTIILSIKYQASCITYLPSKNEQTESKFDSNSPKYGAPSAKQSHKNS